MKTIILVLTGEITSSASVRRIGIVIGTTTATIGGMVTGVTSITGRGSSMMSGSIRRGRIGHYPTDYYAYEPLYYGNSYPYSYDYDPGYYDSGDYQGQMYYYQNAYPDQSQSYFDSSVYQAESYDDQNQTVAPDSKDDRQQVEDLLKTWLNVSTSNDLQGEAALYSDPVAFQGRDTTHQGLIAEFAADRQRWPYQRFSLDTVQINEVAPSTWSVTFRVSYAVSRTMTSKPKAGKTDIDWIVQRDSNGGLKITSARQQGFR